jgi:Fur family ferric uptake transcriptional regulator
LRPGAYAAENRKYAGKGGKTLDASIYTQRAGGFEGADKAPDHWPEGMKRTKQRSCVFSVLKSADTPLSAADIYGKIGKDAGALSTVYRILELFTKEGLAMRTVLLDGGAAVYELDRHEHRHYAVCLKCHKIVALKNCPMETFTPDVKEDNFHVLGHTLELQGICGECYKKNT